MLWHYHLTPHPAILYTVVALVCQGSMALSAPLPRIYLLLPIQPFDSFLMLQTPCSKCSGAVLRLCFHLLFSITLLAKHVDFSNLSHYWQMFHPRQNRSCLRKLSVDWSISPCSSIGVCLTYFEALSLGACVFKIVMYSWGNDPFIAMKWHLLFVVIFFALKFTLPPCSTAWKLFKGWKLGQSVAHPICFPSQELLSFVACRPLS